MGEFIEDVEYWNKTKLVNEGVLEFILGKMKKPTDRK